MSSGHAEAKHHSSKVKRRRVLRCRSLSDVGFSATASVSDRRRDAVPLDDAQRLVTLVPPLTGSSPPLSGSVTPVARPPAVDVSAAAPEENAGLLSVRPIFARAPAELLSIVPTRPVPGWCTRRASAMLASTSRLAMSVGEVVVWDTTHHGVVCEAGATHLVVFSRSGRSWVCRLCHHCPMSRRSDTASGDAKTAEAGTSRSSATPG